jgi:DNA polymerase III subunit chi
VPPDISPPMPEVWFYHLKGLTLEDALPALLEKTLARGLKAVVRVGSPERLKALDDHLWTYREEAFLPHGAADEGEPATQPVFLTLADERPNAAEVGFAVDGAPLQASDGGWQRLVLIFDGSDDEALANARATWKERKALGDSISYWQQDGSGRWQKKA